MLTPVEILKRVDFLCPGDRVKLKKNGMIGTVDTVILSSEGLKIRIEEDASIYNENEYVKTANSYHVRKTFFLP